MTGIDIWNKLDQSGNAKSVTLRNTSLEEFADRVRIETGHMRELPFPDSTFDPDRKRAIVEGYRDLKPGGEDGIADIRATTVYEAALRTIGASNVERRRLGWRFRWGNPVAAHPPHRLKPPA